MRYSVIGVTAFAAFLMYLDRSCMSQIVNSDSFQLDLKLSDKNVAYVVSGFFWAYALGQMPGAWFGDRFGARPLLTWLILIWSCFTLLTGFATGLWTLMLARIGCGLAEAGAYPCSGSLIPRWTPLASRGRANAVVAGGGRLGGAAAPWLTNLAMARLGTWRAAGWTFGAGGLLFALLFYWICRDRPAEHPQCNEAERALIEHGSPDGAHAPRADRLRTPWLGLLRSPDMWLMCLYQFLTNVGWVFLITYMPKFLRQAKGLPQGEAALLSTMALLAGIVGMLSGGWLTDALTRRFGLQRGRRIPLVWSRVAGAGAYLACLWLESPWWTAAAFGVVAAMTDVSIPAGWGYVQDVGGRHIASAYAWPNMWGNFGAGLSPLVLNKINDKYDHEHNWHLSLIFLAAAFLLSGVAACWIRADVKIVEAPERAVS